MNLSDDNITSFQSQKLLSQKITKLNDNLDKIDRFVKCVNQFMKNSNLFSFVFNGISVSIPTVFLLVILCRS